MEAKRCVECVPDEAVIDEQESRDRFMSVMKQLEDRAYLMSLVSGMRNRWLARRGAGISVLIAYIDKWAFDSQEAIDSRRAFRDAIGGKS